MTIIKTVKAIIVPNGAEQGRKFFDNMTTYAVEEAGAKGLGWVKIDNENNVSGGIAKFVTDEVKTGLEKIGAKYIVATLANNVRWKLCLEKISISDACNDVFAVVSDFLAKTRYVDVDSTVENIGVVGPYLSEYFLA